MRHDGTASVFGPAQGCWDLLEQMAQYGTLFRIDGATATYDVLSAVQLLT